MNESQIAQALGPKIVEMEANGIVFSLMRLPYVAFRDGKKAEAKCTTLFLVSSVELADKIEKLVNDEPGLENTRDRIGRN